MHGTYYIGCQTLVHSMASIFNWQVTQTPYGF